MENNIINFRISKFSYYLIICIVASLSTFISIPIQQEDESLLQIIEQLSCKTLWILLIAVTIFLFFIYIDKFCKHCLTYYILALFIALSWAASYSYLYVASLQLLYCSTVQILKCVLYTIGMSAMIYYGIRLFKYLLLHENKQQLNNVKFWHILVLIVIFWLPSIIISYPANIYGDTWNQIAVAYDYRIKSTHHPAVPTMLLYFFTTTSQTLFGSRNIGMYLVELIQTLFAASSFSYMLHVMIHRLKAPRWLVIFSFILIILSPYWTNSSITLVKDVPYSISILLFTIQLVLLLIDKVQFFKSKINIIICFVSIIVICLFRNNGVYFMLLIIPFVFVLLIKMKQTKKILIFLLPIVAALVINNSIVSRFGFIKGETYEMLHLPMQQIARIASYHPDRITAEEKEIISKVCDYDKMTENYFPLLADQVKSTYNRGASDSDYLSYVKVWIQIVCRNPVTAISAIINQNFPLIFPFLENYDYYVGADSFHSYSDILAYDPIAKELGIVSPDSLSAFRELLLNIYFFIDKLPIIGYFSQQAIYMIILIVLLVFSVQDKSTYFFMASIPSFATLIMIILGPSIQYMPRYFFPIAYSIPLLCSYYVYLRGNQQ